MMEEAGGSIKAGRWRQHDFCVTRFAGPCHVWEGVKGGLEMGEVRFGGQEKWEWDRSLALGAFGEGHARATGHAAKSMTLPLGP